MNPANANDPDAVREEEAAEWIWERENGLAPGRTEAFTDWRNRDPRNAAALARVERTLAILEEMPVIRRSLDARVGSSRDNAGTTKSADRRTRIPRWAWAAGMAAAVLIAGAGVWWQGNPPVSAAQFYDAMSTEPRRVPLADGSVIDLNLNSRVEVKFSENKRQVTLVAGEAHFQVAHNRDRPFIVSAKGISVRAVGTAFDVRLAGEKIDVLVVEGKVEVARVATPGVFASRTVPLVPLLAAGERVQVTVGGDVASRVEEIAAPQTHDLLAWQNRMTSFADVPLREMVARINRCNVPQLVIGDPQLGDRRVGGVVDLKQVDAFVRLLEQDGDIVSDRSTSGEIVLRRAR